MGEGLALGGPRCHRETRGRGRGSGGAGVPSSAVLASAAPGLAAIVPVGTTVPARHENLPVAYAARGLHENDAAMISTPNGMSKILWLKEPCGSPDPQPQRWQIPGAGFSTKVSVGTTVPMRLTVLPVACAACSLHEQSAVCVHGDRGQRCCMREPYQASSSSLLKNKLMPSSFWTCLSGAQ